VVPTYWNNQNAHQPDGTKDLSGVDFRIGSNNVYQVGDILWAAQSILTSAVTGNGVYDAIRWYEINATANTLLQSGTISDPHHDYNFPSMAANAAGDVIIGFSATGDSTTSDFPGAWFVAGTTIGGVTTFDVAQELQNGFGDYHLLDDNGRNRWGDFGAISVDPNDPNAFWIAEEVAIQGSSRVPIVWGTQISELVFVPEPASLALLMLGLAVAAVPGAASVRVWEIMSRGRGPRGGRPPPEGADVALDEAGWPCQVAIRSLPQDVRSVPFTAGR
jgi:hypothetical protein